MNPEKLKEYMKIAKESVKDEKDEQLKIEAYKIILEKLLDGTTAIQKSTSLPKTNVNTDNPKTEIINFEQGKIKLAQNCGISLSQLDDVISINKNDDVEIIAPVTGNDPKKHIIATLCILAAREFILGEEWIESPIVAESIRSIGAGGLSNLSFTLKRYPTLTRTRGSRGKNKQYKLTTNEGRTKAFEIIRKLAKGEEIDV